MEHKFELTHYMQNLGHLVCGQPCKTARLLLTVALAAAAAEETQPCQRAAHTR